MIRKQVEEFHVAGRVPILPAPAVPDAGRVMLRARLVGEEFCEFMEALFPDSYYARTVRKAVMFPLEGLEYVGDDKAPDLTNLADACADLDYVVEGTRLEFGIDGEPIARIVHESNMAKFGPGSRVREDGKIMKPSDWKPPDIEAELRRQAFRSWGYGGR